MSCLPPRCSTLIILRTSLLRSRSTATTVGATAPRTRRFCIGSRQSSAAISLQGSCNARLFMSTLLRRPEDGRMETRRFHTVNDRGDGRKDEKVETNRCEDGAKDGEDNVIYYQSPPEGYEEPARKSAPVSTTLSKDEPQLGYIFENVMPTGTNDKASNLTNADTVNGIDRAGIRGGMNTDEGGYSSPMSSSANAQAACSESNHGTQDTLRNRDEWANGSVGGLRGDAGPTSTSEIASEIAEASMDGAAKAAADGNGLPNGAAFPPGVNDTIKWSTNNLPSQIQQRRSEWRKKFENMMDNMQSNVFMAGQTLNDLTGYSAIERLKQEITQQEEAVRAARRRVRDCKEAYTDAIHRRSASQREVNELLQRKHAWSPTDVERFTSLYRSDHANERGEAMAQEELANAERESEEASTTLSRTILARYHEEQIWSDKIRRMSTWGTWGLMGVNVLLFLVFQIAVEPWRRKRLVTGFEEKVLAALEKEREITVQRENIKKTDDAGSLVAAATAAIGAVREAAREMKGAIRSVGEQFDANEEVVGNDMILGDDSAEIVPVIIEPMYSSKGVGEAAFAATPESSSSAPLPLDEEDLRTQFHRFIAKTLVKVPPAVAQRFIDYFRNDTTVSMSPRDLSAIALESAAAGAALTSVAAGILVMVFRGQ